jgi:Subtilase family
MRSIRRYATALGLVLAAGAVLVTDGLSAKRVPPRPAAAHSGPRVMGAGARLNAVPAATQRPRFDASPARAAGARQTASARFAHGPRSAGNRTAFSRFGSHGSRSPLGPGRSHSGLFRHGSAQHRLFRPQAARNSFLGSTGHQHWVLPGERGFTGVPPAGETRFIASEMVLRVTAATTPEVLDGIAQRHGLTVLAAQDFALDGTRIYRLRVGGGREVADVIHDLEAENLPVAAQPNYRFRLQQDVRSPLPSSATNLSQYTVGKLRLAETHQIATGNNVSVALIDSEVDARHPDLTGSVADRFEPVAGDDKPHLHGTGMAGAIASHRRLVGVAPHARLLVAHAFSPDANGDETTSERILMGLDWAVRKGARIVNMSFAGPRDPLIGLAIKNAAAKGIVIIAAAGNAGPKSPPLYPAADPNVIAVTATDINDAVFAGANRGAHIAVAAPGVDILEPAPNGRYQITTGTSVAAAHVTGVVALLIERKPDADLDTVRRILTSTAKDVSGHGRDDAFGWGLVDPYRALRALDTASASSR